MAIRDDIRQALWDAIGWQSGLAEAYSHIKDSPEYREAINQIKAYRRILKRRYVDARPPLDRQLANAELVNIFDVVDERKPK